MVVLQIFSHDIFLRNIKPIADASDYIKELVMCLIFIQAEVCLIAPHLMREVIFLQHVQIPGIVYCLSLVL